MNVHACYYMCICIQFFKGLILQTWNELATFGTQFLLFCEELNVMNCNIQAQTVGNISGGEFRENILKLGNGNIHEYL